MTFSYAFGFAIYNGLFQNYFREVIHGQPDQLGKLESLREVPGLLTAFTASALVMLSETRLAAAALGASAIGIAATGMVPGYWSLVAVTVFWSVGLHLWFTLQPAITLTLSRGATGGRNLGRMSAVGAAAVLVALLLTRLAKPHLSYSVLFGVAGGLIALAGLLGLGLSQHASSRERPRLVYRRQYRLYYVLTFLEGCRRQIFGTFASFVLIVVYSTSVETMLTLALINSVVSMLSAPLVGALIDRIGERPVLTVYYFILIFVFAGYALIRDVHVLYGMYIVDSLLFACALAITTYLNRTVESRDITPSLAMGTTMNHLAAVVVPVTGGILWKTLGNFQIPFWIGIGLVIASLVVSQLVPARTSHGGDAAGAPLEPEVAVAE